MEEVESEEYIEQINNNNIFDNSPRKENFTAKKSNYSLTEDPIPHLINPLKQPIPNYTSMSYIISNFPKMNINLEQIQFMAKDKINLYLINQNLQKHNSTPELKNIMLIEDLIKSKDTHFTTLFKDYLLMDYNEEFLRGYFNENESKEVLPKFYDYYKNYLKFFCKSTFNNFYINEIIQEYGENQAEVYYNINYKKKERLKKKDKKENLDEKNLEESYKTDSKQNDNISKLISLNSFFTKSIIKHVNEDNEESLIKKKNQKELSNIKPLKNNDRQNTINLPDDSTVSIDDVITKKSSIINIIDLMSNKLKKKQKNKNKYKNKNMNNNNNNNYNNNNKKFNKKIELIFIDNKKLNNNRNILNKKCLNSFSKTTSNLNDKSKNLSKESKNNKTKKLISRNKANNSNINNIISKNNKILSSSNYIKYIDVLKNKKNIKNDISKNKQSQNELLLTSSRNIKNKKLTNNITSFNTNDNNYNLNIFSNSNISNNVKNSKNKNHNISRINLSLKIKNFYQKIKTVNNNSLYPLSISKGNINRSNIGKKFEPIIKEKEREKNSKSKSKSNKNTSNNFFFKKNIKKNLNQVKGISFSPRNIYYHNKSLSYSTVNNCNININNNIILSNNYFNNNKYSQIQHQINNSTKKLFENNINPKKHKINNVSNKHLTSRNIRIDLDKFKTEENIVNSLVLQGTTSHKILKIKDNESNIQYTSFRKSNNNGISIKQRNLFKIKKNNININNKKHLTLKNIPVMNNTKSSLNYNNTSKRIYINDELSSINKTYKNLYIKNNNINNANNSNKKIIFDYKNK